MNKEALLAAVIALVLGLGGGYGIAQLTADDSSETATSEETAHTEEKSESTTMHEHAKYEVTAEEAPTVELSVTEDSKGGWNVHLNTTKFTFAPDHVNGEEVLGEGHAHLYVGDELIARLYGPDFHYRGEFDGTKTFRVTLNTNMHSEYAVDGVSVESSVDVTHDHETMPHAEESMDHDSEDSHAH